MQCSHVREVLHQYSKEKRNINLTLRNFRLSQWIYVRVINDTITGEKKKNNKIAVPLLWGSNVASCSIATNSSCIAGVVLCLLGCNMGKRSWYVSKLTGSLVEELFIFSLFHKHVVSGQQENKAKATQETLSTSELKKHTKWLHH